MMRYYFYLLIGCILPISLWASDAHFQEEQQLSFLAESEKIDIENERAICYFSTLPEELISAIIIFSSDWDQWAALNHYFYDKTREFILPNFNLDFATSLTCLSYLSELEIFLLKHQKNPALIEKFSPRFFQQTRLLFSLIERMSYAPTLGCSSAKERIEAIKNTLDAAIDFAANTSTSKQIFQKFATSIFRDPVLISLLTLVAGYSAYSLFYESPSWWRTFQSGLDENFTATLDHSKEYLNSTASHGEIAENMWKYANWWSGSFKDSAFKNATCIESHIEMWASAEQHNYDYCVVRDVLETKGGLRHLWTNNTEQISTAQKILGRCLNPFIKIPADYLFKAQALLLEAYEKSGYEASASLTNISYHPFYVVDIIPELSNDTFKTVITNQLALRKGRAINGAFQQCLNMSKDIENTPLDDIMAFWARGVLRFDLNCLAEQNNLQYKVLLPTFYVPIIFNSLYFIFYFCGLYVAFSCSA